MFLMHVLLSNGQLISYRFEIDIFLVGKAFFVRIAKLFKQKVTKSTEKRSDANREVIIWPLLS